ncbi:conjugative transfer region protein [Salmonella enterica subsp. enterica serovar Typhi]|nr:conjugative transfer region protein [Salmonella enterica subsp. enterica serovar Typhi]
MKTIEFLPDRLNAETVVFRGFTTPELGYAALIGAVSGLILSLIMMLVNSTDIYFYRWTLSGSF